MTGIAHQYALAVFSLADEAGRADTFLDDLTHFAEGLDEKTQSFFIHPKIARQDKQNVLDTAVKDPLLANFLKVLVDNQRFSLINAILLAYREILDNRHKVMHVLIYSNQPLSEENLKKITNKLSKRYHRTVESEHFIDTSIIGGVRIEFEGNVIDETINRQLENIKSSLLE